jgi:putative ABC transport system substrate-binding protein
VIGALLAAFYLVVHATLPNCTAAAEIAILKSSDIAAYTQAIEAFKAALPDIGFIEYDLQGDVARGRKLARQIRASDPSLVFAVGLKAALVAKLEIVDTPVIFSMVLDPAKYDLKASNMAGISLEVPLDRQFSTIRAILPRLKRIGVLYDPEKTGALLDAARRQARTHGLEIVERKIRTENQLPATAKELILQVDALWLIPDSTVLTEESLGFLLSTALDHNVPVIAFSPEFVRHGALFGLSVHPADIGRQTALLAKKLLAGTAPSSISTVSPEQVRLAVNLKTARFLGIMLSPDVLTKAHEVY